MLTFKKLLNESVNHIINIHKQSINELNQNKVSFFYYHCIQSNILENLVKENKNSKQKNDENGVDWSEDCIGVDF